MVTKFKTKKKSSKLKKLMVIMAVLFFLAAGFAVAYLMNHITKLEITGNSFYSDEEIEEMIFEDDLQYNAWYLYWRYHYAEAPQFPFVDKIEIELKGRGDVKVRVYEKSIVGYVDYLGTYMYFDKDGTVVESSMEVMEGIPRITGLQFDTIVLSEKLPVKEEKVFNYILNLTKELKKNEILPDKIYFNDAMEATLYFNQARVALGTDDNQNEKITRLKSIIPELSGKVGVLHMEEVNEENKNIIFEKD